MTTAKKLIALAFIIGVTAMTTACKKEQVAAPTDEVIIKIPPGLVHIGTQWVDGKIWVESFDPITNACLLRQYDAEGKVVEGSTKVRLKACRIDKNVEKVETDETQPEANVKPVATKPLGKTKAVQGAQK